MIFLSNSIVQEGITSIADSLMRQDRNHNDEKYTSIVLSLFAAPAPLLFEWQALTVGNKLSLIHNQSLAVISSNDDFCSVGIIPSNDKIDIRFDILERRYSAVAAANASWFMLYFGSISKNFEDSRSLDQMYSASVMGSVGTIGSNSDLEIFGSTDFDPQTETYCLPLTLRISNVFTRSS